MTEGTGLSKRILSPLGAEACLVELVSKMQRNVRFFSKR